MEGPAWQRAAALGDGRLQLPRLLPPGGSAAGRSRRRSNRSLQSVVVLALMALVIARGRLRRPPRLRPDPAAAGAAVAGLRVRLPAPPRAPPAPGGGPAEDDPQPDRLRALALAAAALPELPPGSPPAPGRPLLPLHPGLAPKRGGLPRRRPGPEHRPRQADHGRGIPGAAPAPRALSATGDVDRARRRHRRHRGGVRGRGLRHHGADRGAPSRRAPRTGQRRRPVPPGSPTAGRRGAGSSTSRRSTPTATAMPTS